MCFLGGYETRQASISQWIVSPVVRNVSKCAVKTERKIGRETETVTDGEYEVFSDVTAECSSAVCAQFTLMVNKFLCLAGHLLFKVKGVSPEEKPPRRALVVDPNVCCGQTVVLQLLCLSRHVIGPKKAFSHRETLGKSQCKP